MLSNVKVSQLDEIHLIKCSFCGLVICRMEILNKSFLPHFMHLFHRVRWKLPGIQQVNNSMNYIFNEYHAVSSCITNRCTPHQMVKYRKCSNWIIAFSWISSLWNCSIAKRKPNSFKQLLANKHSATPSIPNYNNNSISCLWRRVKKLSAHSNCVCIREKKRKREHIIRLAVLTCSIETCRDCI